ncbi:hypothetical protein, partial [Finegoldia magna]|uniref:hypothetical protein n=1 Tax=Finegoldia magna TaxID=1260 RepID=UPI000B9F0BA0
VNSYTHIAYSNSQNGSKDFSTSNSNREYIGIYVDSNKTDSENYKAYKWSKIKGLDGKDGIPGAKGADGKTPYLHIAYSNSADGSKDFSVNDSNRDYIGQYTDFSKADSTDYKKYSWSKIKGEFEGEIGARNLLKNSDDLSNFFVKYDGGTHTITDEEMTEFGINGKRVYSLRGNQTTSIKSYLGVPVEKLIVGKTYTFSMYVKNNRDVSQRIIVNGFDWSYYDIKGNEAVRIVLTGKRKEMSDPWNDKIQILLCSYDKEWYADMTVSRPQLEEGDVATSWSKNPNDFANELGLAREEFKSFKEETENHFLQTVSLDKYNQFNQLYQREHSELKQTVNSVNAKITKTQNDLKQYSNLSQTVDSISTTVAQIEPLKLSHAKLEQKVNGIQSSVTEISKNTTNVSTLTQKVDSLTSTVASINNGLDNKIGSIIDQKKSTIVLGIGNITGLQKNLDSLQSSITVNEKSITAKADKVDLVGKVSFTDLNDKGKTNSNYDRTFIDGGKIITNTIETRHIKTGSIQSKHLEVDDAMINKLVTNTMLTQKIVGSQANINMIKATDISASRVTTGLLRSKDGSSWIDLNNGNFSFYHNSLFIDENQMDYSSGTRRTRLHTLGTFRVSYGDNPSVELNSGGITLFKDKVSQDSKGTNKIQSNSDGNIQMGTVRTDGSTNIQVEIGATVDKGFVMRTYGSLRVGGNLQVDKSIKYGESISKGSYY